MRNSIYKRVKLNQSATKVINRRRLQSGVKEIRTPAIVVAYK